MVLIKRFMNGSHTSELPTPLGFALVAIKLALVFFQRRDITVSA
ncbi:MAG: hypothetical protein U9R58_11865 [Chloroflexota bacterium]|nr:hypothetical protein [Chloroflexota bacterium]